MKRQEIEDRIRQNLEMIEALKLENTELRKESYLLNDEEQQYFEVKEDVIIKKRPRIVESQIRGYITWKETFMDEDTKEELVINRRMLVRINGRWI
jgi:FtsZ-binding cell division protein ZapB